MSMRRVRFYEGEGGESTVIGFSAGAVDAADHPRFRGLVEMLAHDVKVPGNTPEGSVSSRHVEIVPPLADAEVKVLGELMVGGKAGLPGIVDPYHDGVLAIDNREELPEGPLDDSGVLIASSF